MHGLESIPVANDSGASTQGGQGELRWGNCRLTMSEGMPNVVVDGKWGSKWKGSVLFSHSFATHVKPGLAQLKLRGRWLGDVITWGDHLNGGRR